MKKLNLIVCAALITAVGIFGGCIDDNSTMATGKVDGVTIDTTGMGTLSVLQFTNLEVKPNIKTELSESDLSYEWKLNTTPSDTLYEVLSHDKNLDATIKRKSNSGDVPYQLLYTVTDQSTGLDHTIAWPLNVKNSLGEGLVVAHSSGANTDLGLILSQQVTPDYTDVKVTSSVYSTVNNDFIEGSVKDILYTSILGVPWLLTITDHSITQINRQDFTYANKNEAVFFAHGANFEPQALYKAGQSTVYIGEGNLTGVNFASTPKFTAPFDFDSKVPAQVAVNAGDEAAIVFNYYDEAHGQFVYLPTAAAFGDNAMHATPASTAGAFNPASVPNKKNIAAVAATNGDFRHLLRDKNTGDFNLYVFNGGALNYPNADPPEPITKYDFSDAPKIQNANFFVLADNQKVLYYATDTKIYAVIYGTSSPTYQERYTVPAGESITTLQLYHQAFFFSRSSLLDTDGRQLVMSTYDGSEGKVYLLPIVNLGVGNIDEANIKTYGGFGKVTAVAPQQ